MYALTAARIRPCNWAKESVIEPGLGSVFRERQLENFEPGQSIFWQGDPVQHIFEVKKGIIRLCRILPDGERVIAGFMYPGDVLGIAYRDKYLFTAEAVTDTAVRRMPRTRFYAMVDESPELRPTLLARLSDEMCAAQDQMLLLLHRNADARVASFLLMVARKLCRKVENGSELYLPMSRKDIGDYLGLTIETVCRCFTKLKGDGYIALRGPHQVILSNPHGLRDLAGEEDESGIGVHRTVSAVWPN